MASVATVGDRRHDANPAYWLGVIDVDHFKRVNDNFGHLIGDEVLLLLSRLMRTCFRFHDRLYRFGGEEFVAVIRCESEDDALQAFERLRQACEQYNFPQVGQRHDVGRLHPGAAAGFAGRCFRAGRQVGLLRQAPWPQPGALLRAAWSAKGELVVEAASSGDVDLF